MGMLSKGNWYRIWVLPVSPPFFLSLRQKFRIAEGMVLIAEVFAQQLLKYLLHNLNCFKQAQLRDLNRQ